MHITFLTGAGISKESGIETFRDSDGLWGKYPIEKVATIEAWQRNPELCCDFYAERRAQVNAVQPNEAHLAIAEMQKANPEHEIHIITQNVDDLHERSGAQNILHLHGCINEILVETEAGLMITDYCKELHHCKPNIVMFGEDVPNIIPAIEIVEVTDLLVVVGTSLEVYPANSLLEYISSGCQVYNINPASPEVPASDVVYIQKTATKGVPALIKTLELK